MTDVVVSFYRVVDGVAGAPPDGAAELLAHLTSAQVQDELLSFVELEDDGEAALIGYPLSGALRCLCLEVGTASAGLADAALETMRRHELTAFRWPLDVPTDVSNPPVGFTEPRAPWLPDALAVADVGRLAEMPARWGTAQVIDTSEAARGFLARR